MPLPPLDGLIDDLYYLEGAPAYARLTLPPAALLIVNLGAPFLVRAGTDIDPAEYADGCVVTMPTRAWEFGYPLRTRSVGVHFKPWGLAPFLPVPAAELCDWPVKVEQVWGRPVIAELGDRLATVGGPHEMLALLEEELLRRLCETAGLGLVRQTSSVIAATSGAVAIGDLRVRAGVSTTHLAQRFKELIGVTPKRREGTARCLFLPTFALRSPGMCGTAILRPFAVLLMFGLVCQVALAGVGAFAQSAAWEWHRTLGVVTEAVALTAAIAVIGFRRVGVRWPWVGIFTLISFQHGSAAIGGWQGFHSVSAVLMLALAGVVVRRLNAGVAVPVVPKLSAASTRIAAAIP